MGRKIILLVFIAAYSVAFSQLSADDQRKIDSLKAKVLTAKYDSTVVSAWMEWDNMIYYQDEELDLRLNNKIDSLCDINLRGDLTKKEKLFFLSAKAFALNSFGLIYKSKGNYILALDASTEGLEIYQELDNRNGVSSISSNIGNIHFSLENYDKALEFYELSLKIDTEMENQYGIATCLNNIGLVYSEYKKYDLSRDYYQKSLKIAREIGNKIEESNCLNNLGLSYFSQGKHQKAISLYELSLKIVDSIGFKANAAGCYNNIGNAYLKLNDLQSALNASNKGLSISKEINENQLILSASDNLYRIHKKLGNKAKALEMLELFQSVQKELKSAEQKKHIAQQEFKLKIDQNRTADSIKNAEAIKVKNAEIAKNQAETNAQKQQKYYLYIGLILLVTFGLFMFNRYKLISKQKNTIDDQKRLVEEQKRSVELQKDKIERQHQQLGETHKEISDSIKYAERLQMAMLPSMESFNSNLNDGFILFIPKNIVSGDFYWVYHADETTFFAVADCTGHGVPGAMVSVVCCNALNQSVKEFGLREPNEILNKTREIVIETFANSSGNVKDGMDIALCALKGNSLKYSGANNPLWIVRKNEYLTDSQLTQNSTLSDEKISLIEFKSNKQPIGSFEDMKDFDQEEINLFEGDMLYLFSDGFADQFGGPKGKKFMYKPFKKHLISISNLSMSDQKATTKEVFLNWKGAEEQVDDVCICGIAHIQNTP